MKHKSTALFSALFAFFLTACKTTAVYNPETFKGTEPSEWKIQIDGKEVAAYSYEGNKTGYGLSPETCGDPTGFRLVDSMNGQPKTHYLFHLPKSLAGKSGLFGKKNPRIEFNALRPAEDGGWWDSKTFGQFKISLNSKTFRFKGTLYSGAVMEYSRELFRTQPVKWWGTEGRANCKPGVQHQLPEPLQSNSIFFSQPTIIFLGIGDEAISGEKNTISDISFDAGEDGDMTAIDTFQVPLTPDVSLGIDAGGEPIMMSVYWNEETSSWTMGFAEPKTVFKGGENNWIPTEVVGGSFAGRVFWTLKLRTPSGELKELKE